MDRQPAEANMCILSILQIPIKNRQKKYISIYTWYLMFIFGLFNDAVSSLERGQQTFQTCSPYLTPTIKKRERCLEYDTLIKS